MDACISANHGSSIMARIEKRTAYAMKAKFILLIVPSLGTIQNDKTKQTNSDAAVTPLSTPIRYASPPRKIQISLLFHIWKAIPWIEKQSYILKNVKNLKY